ncbi:MAG: hypothetical protein OHK0013_01840 [Sandaracinaceae bacterium]
MKLLADVNVSGAVVERLRAHGWEVARVTDHVSPDSSDEIVLQVAARAGAVLMTRDQDFPALLARSRAAQPSVLNLRCTTVDADELAAVIDQALRAASDDLARGAIVTIDDGGARSHPLPLG